jgi:hypothetical protein
MQQKQEERKFRKQLKRLRKGKSLKNFSRVIMNYIVVKKIREYCITLSYKQLKLTVSWFLDIDNFSEIDFNFLIAHMKHEFRKLWPLHTLSPVLYMLHCLWTCWSRVLLYDYEVNNLYMRKLLIRTNKPSFIFYLTIN